MPPYRYTVEIQEGTNAIDHPKQWAWVKVTGPNGEILANVTLRSRDDLPKLLSIVYL